MFLHPLDQTVVDLIRCTGLLWPLLQDDVHLSRSLSLYVNVTERVERQPIESDITRPLALPLVKSKMFMFSAWLDAFLISSEASSHRPECGRCRILLFKGEQNQSHRAVDAHHVNDKQLAPFEECFLTCRTSQALMMSLLFLDKLRAHHQTLLHSVAPPFHVPFPSDTCVFPVLNIP